MQALPVGKYCDISLERYDYEGFAMLNLGRLSSREGRKMTLLFCTSFSLRKLIFKLVTGPTGAQTSDMHCT